MAPCPGVPYRHAALRSGPGGPTQPPEPLLWPVRLAVVVLLASGAVWCATRPTPPRLWLTPHAGPRSARPSPARPLPAGLLQRRAAGAGLRRAAPEAGLPGPPAGPPEVAPGPAGGLAAAGRGGSGGLLAAGAVAAALVAHWWRQRRRPDEAPSPVGTAAAALLVSCALASAPPSSAAQLPLIGGPPASSPTLESFRARAVQSAQAAVAQLPPLPTLSSLPPLPALPPLPSPAALALPPLPALPALPVPRLPFDPHIDSVAEGVAQVAARLQALLPAGGLSAEFPAAVDFDSLWATLGLDDVVTQVSDLLRTDPRRVTALLAEVGQQVAAVLPNPARGGTTPAFLQPAVNHPVLWVTSWALLTSALVAAATPAEEPYGEDALPPRYDLRRIRAYFSRRPYERAQRTFAILDRFGRWAVRYYLDVLTGAGRDNERRRAQEIVTITSELGPAFIKIAQAVSMRPDLLSPVYISELQKLQDRVPPFDDDLAADIVMNALPPGTSLSSLFKYGRAAITKPVAAASIGQVYRVELQAGGVVALKVQRPDLLQMVSLDLFIVQDLLEKAAASGLSQDLTDACNGMNGVISAWAARFIEELDYEQEATNQTRFAESMGRSSFLRNSLRVPTVFSEYTTRYTLMTEWIEGTRLIDMDVRSPEGRGTIAMLLNAYLVQLLGTGFLHADPHLGNFLRSAEDGKLVVLDYGLMTEVTENQRYAILEYIAHLSARDYEATLKDLVALEFIPESIDEDPQKRAIVAPLLGEVLRELQKGGGAQRINVEMDGAQVERLGKEYPLVIPPYFGLILRTFSSLEGFGLRSDENYAIVDQCFPYMAHRLLTDDSPRIRNVLRTFLYGGSATQLRVDRVEEMLAGFRTFNSLAPQSGRAANPAAMDPVTQDAVRLLLAPNGNYVQELVVDELVRIIDTGSRSVLLTLLRQLHSTSKERMADPSLLGQLARANPLLPVLTQVVEQNIAWLDLSEEDRHSVAVAERLVQILQPYITVPAAPPSPTALQAAVQMVQQWSPLALDVLPGVQRMSLRGLEKLLARATLRLAALPAPPPLPQLPQLTPWP